jgi:hypothetical protein
MPVARERRPSRVAIKVFFLFRLGPWLAVSLGELERSTRGKPPVARGLVDATKASGIPLRFDYRAPRIKWKKAGSGRARKMATFLVSTECFKIQKFRRICLSRHKFDTLDACFVSLAFRKYLQFMNGKSRDDGGVLVAVESSKLHSYLPDSPADGSASWR